MQGTNKKQDERKIVNIFICEEISQRDDSCQRREVQPHHNLHTECIFS